MDRWWREPGLHLDSLFGSDWPQGAFNLARYYVKNFGCQMADQGVRPPSTMAAFLDGAQTMNDVNLALVKSESHHVGHRRLRRLGPNVALFRPADRVWVSPSQKRFTGYEGAALIGYVGVLLQWQEGSGPCDGFFNHPYPVLNRLSARPGLQAELSRMAVQRGIKVLRANAEEVTKAIGMRLHLKRDVPDA